MLVKMKFVGNNTQLAWLLFGNETEQDVATNQLLSKEDIDYLVEMLKCNQTPVDPVQKGTLNVEQLLYWWKKQDFEDMSESFSTQPLFLVKWHSLSYNEMSWEPLSIVKQVSSKKLDRFVRNVKVKRSLCDRNKHNKNN